MRIAWMTWLPVNGWVAQNLLETLSHVEIELVPVPPHLDLGPAKAMALVIDLHQNYQGVALLITSILAEALRLYKIQNYKKSQNNFIPWYSPQFFNEGRKVRWCRVG